METDGGGLGIVCDLCLLILDLIVFRNCSLSKAVAFDSDKK
jgi:hypothetical protein